MKKLILIFTLLVFAQSYLSQSSSNQKVRYYSATGDSLRIDSLSVVPGSMIVQDLNGTVISEDKYFLDPLGSMFFMDSLEFSDSLRLKFRIFPIDFSAPITKKDVKIIQPSLLYQDPLTYKVRKENTFKVFEESSLQRNGSISRGLVVGNRQNLSINSDFNLQLSGKLSNKINILANISDDNIPIQAEGNTQQLQEFDNIFIKLYDERSSLVAGDFRMDFDKGRFLRFAKKTRGLEYLHTNSAFSDKDSTQSLKLGASLAISKGKFAVNNFRGVEGNQGPYRLVGAENELFVIVLSGTERVFIDGKLMQRGQDNDYVIDYNSSELTFTSAVLVTKDLRIRVEFQYSDQNYARSVLGAGVQFEKKKSRITFNAYSEQDSKNQPLQQDLTEQERSLLNVIGDDLSQAFIQSIDSTSFSDSEVLYQLIDSLGYDSVFVFRPDPDSVHYRLNFSFVGQNNGNYVQDGFTPNGRKFRWIAPDTISGQIVRQGDYLPVRRLVTPQKRQMLAMRYERKWKPQELLYIEGSLSSRDFNTFSESDDGNNNGYGLNIGVVKRISVNDKTDIEVLADHEYRSNDFEIIERYRDIEFDIDWNYDFNEIDGDQHLSKIGLGIVRENANFVKWSFRSLLEEKNYQGFKHEIQLNWKKSETSLKANASILNTEGINESNFVRQQADFSQGLNWFKIGFKNEFRSNRLFLNQSDSLSSGSLEFLDGEFYVANKDSSDHNFRLFFRNRLDKLSNQTRLEDANKSEIYGLQYAGKISKDHFMDVTVSNRSLKIIDENLSIQDAEDTFIGKLNYRGKALDRGISFSTYYDISSGLEPKREFVYIQVPAGQGVYVWVDYNENDIKDLEEFEIAKFQYEADYIRTFTLTNDFQKTFANSFSQSLDINPSIWWSDKKGFLKLMSRFSNLTAINISRKTNRENGTASFNPFLKEIDNDRLINLNSSLREVLFFNKNNLNWGMDFTYSENGIKQLLSNGFESRENQSKALNLRWNITKAIRFDQTVENGTKKNIADFSETRNFNIGFNQLTTSFQYQPGKKYRLKIKGELTAKENNNGMSDLENEQANIQSIGVEGRLSEVGKGNLQLGIDYINTIYDGQGNNALSFEILDGLATGKNFTWNLVVQRTLMKNLQLSLTYNGRQSTINQVIHSGGMQIRAIF